MKQLIYRRVCMQIYILSMMLFFSWSIDGERPSQEILYGIHVIRQKVEEVLHNQAALRKTFDGTVSLALQKSLDNTERSEVCNACTDATVCDQLTAILQNIAQLSSEQEQDAKTIEQQLTDISLAQQEGAILVQEQAAAIITQIGNALLKSQSTMGQSLQQIQTMLGLQSEHSELLIYNLIEKTNEILCLQQACTIALEVATANVINEIGVQNNHVIEELSKQLCTSTADLGQMIDEVRHELLLQNREIYTQLEVVLQNISQQIAQTGTTLAQNEYDEQQRYNNLSQGLTQVEQNILAQQCAASELYAGCVKEMFTTLSNLVTTFQSRMEQKITSQTQQLAHEIQTFYSKILTNLSYSDKRAETNSARISTIINRNIEDRSLYIGQAIQQLCAQQEQSFNVIDNSIHKTIDTVEVQGTALLLALQAAYAQLSDQLCEKAKAIETTVVVSTNEILLHVCQLQANIVNDVEKKLNLMRLDAAENTQILNKKLELLKNDVNQQFDVQTAAIINMLIEINCTLCAKILTAQSQLTGTVETTVSGATTQILNQGNELNVTQAVITNLMVQQFNDLMCFIAQSTSAVTEQVLATEISLAVDGASNTNAILQYMAMSTNAIINDLSALGAALSEQTLTILDVLDVFFTQVARRLKACCPIPIPPG